MYNLILWNVSEYADKRAVVRGKHVLIPVVLLCGHLQSLPVSWLHWLLRMVVFAVGCLYYYGLLATVLRAGTAAGQLQNQLGPHLDFLFSNLFIFSTPSS